MIVNIHSEARKGIRFHTIPDVPWQYPVITEKASFLCLFNDPGEIEADYLAFPWASIIDKRQHGFSIRELPSIRKGKSVFTVCQHIYYRNLAPILKQLGVTVCFACHATEEDIESFRSINIELKPFPLFAVNAAVPAAKKDYIYSFIGMGYNQHILSSIRERIINMSHPASAYVKERAGWHYRNRVYKEQVRGEKMTQLEEVREDDNRAQYMDVLGRSRYSLCPSGTGPNTIRFWESLAAGSIPIVLSDKMLLPDYDWGSCILRVEEKNVDTINDMLKCIPETKEEDMRTRCLSAYRQFSGENFSSSIRHYFEQEKNQ